ncbi:hypothetical protein OROGR_022587 [Orobanche gracilis]
MDPLSNLYPLFWALFLILFRSIVAGRVNPGWRLYAGKNQFQFGVWFARLPGDRTLVSSADFDVQFEVCLCLSLKELHRLDSTINVKLYAREVGGPAEVIKDKPSCESRGWWTCSRPGCLDRLLTKFTHMII